MHRKQISELERSSGTPFGTICRSGLCLTSAISSFGGSLAVRWNRQRTLWGVGLSIQRPRPLVLRLRLHFPRAYLFVLFHVWVEGKKKSSRLAYFSRRVLARRPADQPYTLNLKEVDNTSVAITIGIANAYQIQVVLLVFARQSWAERRRCGSCTLRCRRNRRRSSARADTLVQVDDCMLHRTKVLLDAAYTGKLRSQRPWSEPAPSHPPGPMCRPAPSFAFRSACTAACTGSSRTVAFLCCISCA